MEFCNDLFDHMYCDDSGRIRFRIQSIFAVLLWDDLCRLQHCINWFVSLAMCERIKYNKFNDDELCFLFSIDSFNVCVRIRIRCFHSAILRFACIVFAVVRAQCSEKSSLNTQTVFNSIQSLWFSWGVDDGFQCYNYIIKLSQSID